MPKTEAPDHAFMPLAGGALLQHLRAKHGWSDRQVANAKRDGDRGMERAVEAHRKFHKEPVGAV